MAVAEEDFAVGRPALAGRRFALVSNAKAGGLLGQADPDAALAALFEAEGIEVTVTPQDAGDLPDRIEQAMASGAEAVVVAGGDGSIACAAQHLLGTETALGIVASGTMNLLAKDLRLTPGNPAQAVADLARGDIRRIDAGEVNGQIFLCASMLGTPANLSRHREAGRERGGGLLAWAGFLTAASRALRRNRSISLTLTTEGRTRKLRSPSVTITVNRLEDSSGRLFGRACLDGGKLAIYIVPRSTIWRQLSILFGTVASGRLTHPAIDMFEAESVEIRFGGAALHVLVDGEIRLLESPLRYRVRPAALAVIAPAERA